MIRHAALFRLSHSRGSAAETDFLSALLTLQDIPGVQDFLIEREVSAKNDFDFVVSMRFDSQAEYNTYNDHPRHLTFVQTRWLPEVAAFMENDTVPLHV